MAEIQSLGVHKPTGLDYLISEGLLPQDPAPNSYHWETYASNVQDHNIDEEVLYTKACVVWSQGRFIKNVYRFDLEDEEVVQALITTFASPCLSEEARRMNGTNAKSSEQGYSALKKHRKSLEKSKDTSRNLRQPPRALVVLLQRKAHIHFLHGTSHIVSLPFSIEHAFPAPRGVVLIRKPTLNHSSPASPQLPNAPPNSFFSSQAQFSSSYRQSPTQAKSFGERQSLHRAQPTTSGAKLDDLFQNAFRGFKSAEDDDLATIYCLTDPLADIGVVTCPTRRHIPRNLLGKSQGNTTIEFEPLDPLERVVYVSSGEELSNGCREGRGGLMLLVTINSVFGLLTVWHAWYIDERSLRSLFKKHDTVKAAKVARRSSFLSASKGSASHTPVVRPRESKRESLAAPGTVRPGNDPASTRAPSRRPTRQQEEDAMASQMDPDYVATDSQRAARESRRISSMNAEMRTGPTPATASNVGKRGHSFGGPAERVSFGYLKSRASTPGSVFCHSFGPDDDSIFIDHDTADDVDKSLETIVSHIRATIEAVGVDSVLGALDQGFNRDLVVRKCYSMPWTTSTSSITDVINSIRVVPFKQPKSMSTGNEEKMGLYLHDQASKNLTMLVIVVKARALWPELQDSLCVAVPSVVEQIKMGNQASLIKLKDMDIDAIYLRGSGLIFSLDQDFVYKPIDDSPYQMFAFHNIHLHPDQQINDVDRNPTLNPELDSLLLEKALSRGIYHEVDKDGTFHRRRMRLRPRDDLIYHLLQVCQNVLPQRYTKKVLALWCAAYAWLERHRDWSKVAVRNTEWVALITMIFACSIHLVDENGRASLKMSRLPTGNSKCGFAPSIHEDGMDFLPSIKAWSYLYHDVTQAENKLGQHQNTQKDNTLVLAAAVADELIEGSPSLHMPNHQSLSWSEIARLMEALHVAREEQKLCIYIHRQMHNDLGATVVQLALWLGLPNWGCDSECYYGLEGISEFNHTFTKSNTRAVVETPLTMYQPLGVYKWYESALESRSTGTFPTIGSLASSVSDGVMTTEKYERCLKLTPRLVALIGILRSTNCFQAPAATIVEAIAHHAVTIQILETLPPGIVAPLREAIARCAKDPPASWPQNLLQLVARDDLSMDPEYQQTRTMRLHAPTTPCRDVHTICQALDSAQQTRRTAEANRHAISQLIFGQDRRLVEVIGMMHFNVAQVAECVKQPDWNDTMYFDHQRQVMNWTTTRMIALPAGDGMIHFDSQTPLLTERYHLPGFNSSCTIQPTGQTLTIDRAGLIEEKVNWGYFNAGVSMGLRISRNVKGIDTSWVAFNKPNDLTNRHAGLLLALGLNGHLKALAKWLAFKYLTPKHMMTSVGLLLGLSASYMGTMDSLITRMLSVHITRMLPPGAAELNVSPLTQTAGLMGVGLLYYNTQHRRMSEIMLSEVENKDIEDPDSGPDPLRNESYRLAAGFALGFINLARGGNLHGLHGMHLPERLLGVAVGARPINHVHIFDRATAGAIVAIALIYMKSGDKTIAKKIDIPDTNAQFEHVRPDMLILRIMAKHMILWSDIDSTRAMANGNNSAWISDNMPTCFRPLFQKLLAERGSWRLTSTDVPFINVVAGLAWALSLRYAGSANIAARDEILTILSRFSVFSADSYYYDAKVARASLRRCIDVLALSAATVMAGTGDLQTFRHLRRLHGRIDADTPYGSHLAAHMAIGALFMAGGLYTFGTSNLAIASLICAFYPLFPSDVHDNNVHLQAFRHFWVFAAEARCIVVEDIGTNRPISMPIIVHMRDETIRGLDASTKLTAPCLLPEFDMIKSIETNDPNYWRVKLDFVKNPKHLTRFRQSQRIFVRRCPASATQSSTFTAALMTQKSKYQTQSAPSSQPTEASISQRLLHSMFTLSAFKTIDRSLAELILPADIQNFVQIDYRTTVVDDQLLLSYLVASDEIDALWNLRVLFAWVKRAQEANEKLEWIGEDVVDDLQAQIEVRMREAVDESNNVRDPSDYA